MRGPCKTERSTDRALIHPVSNCPTAPSTSSTSPQSSTAAPPPCDARPNRGRLRGTKVGTRWRFRPEDVRAYLAGETPASVDERAAWDAYVRKVVAAAPPLRPEQIAALSALFDYQPVPYGGD